jgi:hypothetical protein
VTNNVAFSEKTARNYMRVFENRARLKSANVADLAEAYQMLVGQSQRSLETNSARMTKEEAEMATAAVVHGLNEIFGLKIELLELYQTYPQFLKPSPEIAATLELLAKRPSEEELRHHLFCQILRQIGLTDEADHLASHWADRGNPLRLLNQRGCPH